MTADPVRVFANKMKTRRKALKLTQDDAAHRAAMDMSYWGRLERARVEPGVRMLARVAVALETTAAKLLAPSGDELRPEAGPRPAPQGARRASGCRSVEACPQAGMRTSADLSVCTSDRTSVFPYVRTPVLTAARTSDLIDTAALALVLLALPRLAESRSSPPPQCPSCSVPISP
jgi:transcriptional regulator with XRE-family HTH domain